MKEPVVLRIYEHDRSICGKELGLYRLVGECVPVPDVIYAEPKGADDLPPFLFARYVDGVSFHRLKSSGDREAIAQAAFGIGQTLAAIGRFTYLERGADPSARFADFCLASPILQQRMPGDLRDGVSRLLWAAEPALVDMSNEAGLMHGDYNRRNILLRPIDGVWRVAAVLDWEMAGRGCSMGDIRVFLRYERDDRPLAEPHFSNGYVSAGGRLPEDWRRLARLVDLTAICESLTQADLPDAAAVELLGIVRATVDRG